METLQKLHGGPASCINSQRPLLSPGWAKRAYSPSFTLHRWQALLRREGALWCSSYLPRKPTTRLPLFVAHSFTSDPMILYLGAPVHLM